MSGLSETERTGASNLLSLMRKSDLLSLCETVTNKMIAVENVKEATETILSFTKNAEELLRRKKVHRDLIFKYLFQEGVVMSPDSEKHQLVKRTLELWSSVEAVVGRSLQGEVDEPVMSLQQSSVAQCESTDTKGIESFDPLVLGHQFCQWFFQLLNSQNPSLGQPPQDWGPQHFWPDVKLYLLSRAGSEQKEEFVGADVVSLRFLALTKEEHLLFNPNLEPHGLKALASSHGLVRVAVAGTVHRDSACLGIFEQIFGLIRSPLENNSWKIKVVHLKIIGQDALAGTEVTAPALSYNSSELQLLCS